MSASYTAFLAANEIEWEAKRQRRSAPKALPASATLASTAHTSVHDHARRSRPGT